MPTTQEKLAILKQYAREGKIIKGKPYTWYDYMRHKGQLLKSDLATIESITELFGNGESDKNQHSGKS